VKGVHHDDFPNIYYTVEMVQPIKTTLVPGADKLVFETEKQTDGAHLVVPQPVSPRQTQQQQSSPPKPSQHQQQQPSHARPHHEMHYHSNNNNNNNNNTNNSGHPSPNQAAKQARTAAAHMDERSSNYSHSNGSSSPYKPAGAGGYTNSNNSNSNNFNNRAAAAPAAAPPALNSAEHLQTVEELHRSLAAKGVGIPITLDCSKWEYDVTIGSLCTVGQLKLLVSAITGAPMSTMRLVCNGAFLRDNHALIQHTNIRNRSRVVVMSTGSHVV
jgi:hypothetical protein